MRAIRIRDEIIYVIYYDTDLTHRDVAEYLGLQYGSVNRIIKSYEKKK
jgi:CRP-like cAMP-binding protein